MTRASRQHGFSLIETLVGLSLIGIALLLSMALLAQQPKVERRLAAHQEALRTLELVLEQMRASGDLPKDGELNVSDLPEVSASSATDLSISVDVESELGPNLYKVELTASYFVEENKYDLKLESMVFTP